MNKQNNKLDGEKYLAKWLTLILVIILILFTSISNVHSQDQESNLIFITNASHMDFERNIISNIYTSVKDKDNNWSENITPNDYVSVLFEKNLTNKNDITLYAKSLGTTSQIDIYPSNSTNLIARFENISTEGWYKVYLSNLSDNESYAGFDLQIKNNPVSFDYIVDPSANDSSNRIYQCGDVTAAGTYTLNQSISGAGTCLAITANNVVVDCNGKTISYNTGGITGAVGINASNGTATRQNLTIKNCIIIKPSALVTTSYGIQLLRFSNSTIFNNTIFTNGTNDNYGIYVAISSSGNNITRNNIFSKGSTTNNIAIYLAPGATNSIISSNNITTLGTATNYGIYVIGNATFANNNNIISNNLIQPSGMAGAGGASNHGIYITANSSQNNITSNTISTNGTTTNYGIYLNGAATNTPTNNNLIFNNTIQTYGNTTPTNYGIYLQNMANQNNITNNNITTRGAASNYGIYLNGAATLSVNNNTIDSNTIQTIGSTTNNYGIYLLTNANLNNITSNNIATNGTTGNIGIAISGTTKQSNSNIVAGNTLRLYGTTGNHGIYITTNSSQDNISNNDIITNGTTTSYGIYLTGTANNPVNSNTITNNTIQTRCTAAASACYGIYLNSNANQNNLTQNNITTSGTTTNYGIYLIGTAALSANNNIIDSNIIKTSGAAGAGGPSNHGIYLTTNTNYNTIINNNIITNGTTTSNGIYLNGAATNSPANNNTIANNTIQVYGTAAIISNYGIYLTNFANQNNITQNNVTTHGTTTNCGVYINGATALTANSNNIISNTIQAIGNTTNNYGIYLTTNTNLNNITSNNIKTFGSSGNYGIYLLGTATATANNNIILSNIIQTNGTTTDNYAIAFATNANANEITNNNLSTYGTSTNYGIYISGSTFASNYNKIISNTIYTNGSIASNYGIYLYRNVSSSNISRNSITTNGTTTNHGIYGVGTTNLNINNNTIDSNIINATGASAIVSNYGIWLSTSANSNTITNNTIYTSGTTTNYGIYILGTAALPSNNNFISLNTILALGSGINNYGIYLSTNVSKNNITQNTIQTNGTTGNHGIYITTSALQNIVSQNNIITNGTTTSYGIYLLGAAGTPVNSNEVSNNTIQTKCSAAASSCHGIFLQNQANQNNITQNDITTSGTTTNYGIYLFGTAALSVNSNTLNKNIIKTSSILAGAGPSNHGIYLTANANQNIITQNNITTNGTTTNYGIYLNGAATTTPTNNNTITNNTIQTYGTVSPTNYGIYLQNLASQNNITQNDITTHGTTANYGIYLNGAATMAASLNLINLNTIRTIGTTTNNYGIYLLTNASQNNVSNNNIITTGTIGNIGIAVSGTTTQSNSNIITSNTIQTNGTTGNYGIYLTTNTTKNNISKNNIITQGTTTNYGIYLFGIAGAPVNNNTMNNNYITTKCTTTASACHGIYLQNAASQNSITQNNITTGGTTQNNGIYLLGTAALPVNINTLDSNILNVSQADIIVISSFAQNTTIRNNTIIGRDPAYYDINISSNGTILNNQNFASYTFGNVGTTLEIKNPSYGDIYFLTPANGSGTNLSNNIVISNNYIYVNSSNSGLNKSAQLTFYNLALSKPIILRDSAVCTDCTILSNQNKTLVFNVTHFSSYSAIDNAKLATWNDLSINSSYPSNVINIYANYTNSTSNTTITGIGINCSIIYSDIGTRQMTYNSTSNLYYFNRLYMAGKTYHYTVACTDSNNYYASINVTDIIIMYGANYDPKSPDNLTVIQNGRLVYSIDPTSADAYGGNTTQISLVTGGITNSWQGYYGSVNGLISLRDNTGAALYDWRLLQQSGKIYASRAEDADFENINCSNASDIANEEAYLGHKITDIDSVSNTFNRQNHPTFSSGTVTIEANKCRSTNIYVNGTAQNSTFYEVLISDQYSNLIYAALLTNQTGFNNETYNFQMLVGDNGNDDVATPYYFFLELI